MTGGVDKLIAQARDALLDLGPYLVGTKESAAAYDDLTEAIAALRLTLAAAEARADEAEDEVARQIELRVEDEPIAVRREAQRADAAESRADRAERLQAMEAAATSEVRDRLIAAEAREKQLREAIIQMDAHIMAWHFSRARSVGNAALAAGGENPADSKERA